jgi:hypothetical protein
MGEFMPWIFLNNLIIPIQTFTLVLL